MAPKHALATSAYESAVLGNSPAIYYRLGESSGSTAHDDSTHGVDGTYGGSVTKGVTGAIAGDSDTAITTASSGAAVTYSGGSGLPTGNASRSAEMWFTATSGGTQLFEWGSIGTGTAFGVILASNFSVHVEDWTAGVAIDSPVPLLDGN